MLKTKLGGKNCVILGTLILILPNFQEVQGIGFFLDKPQIASLDD